MLMFCRKKKKEKDFTEKDYIQISLNSLIHTLIEISLPDNLRIILDGCDDDDLGTEIGDNLKCVNFDLLFSQKIIDQESLMILKELEDDFRKIFCDIPYGEMEEGFWKIQRQKTRKVIEQIWASEY